MDLDDVLCSTAHTVHRRMGARVHALIVLFPVDTYEGPPGYLWSWTQKSTRASRDKVTLNLEK